MAAQANQQLAGKNPHGPSLAPTPAPRSVEIASSGIRTAHDAASFLSAIIGDVMTEAVPVRIANCGINAMGKLLKVAELQQRYGKVEGNQPADLQLVGPQAATVEAPADPLAEREARLLEELAAVRKERAAS